MHTRAFVKGTLTGAAIAYLWDPVSGRGRRAKARDRAMALARRAGDRADKLTRHSANIIEGKIHGATEPLVGSEPAIDDATVADRVRSVVLGRGDLETRGVVVDVQGGVAHLRGQLEDEAATERLVDLTKQVAGVRDVVSLIHLPDTAAPNKKAARSAGSGASGAPKGSD
jgi:osmotically-inducible protein OsmY